METSISHIVGLIDRAERLTQAPGVDNPRQHDEGVGRVLQVEREVRRYSGTCSQCAREARTMGRTA